MHPYARNEHLGKSVTYAIIGQCEFSEPINMWRKNCPVKSNRETILYSRNQKNFNKRFPQIADALGDLPAETVIDGEVVALDDSGRPDFHRLHHYGAEATRIQYFVFDLLVWNGRDLTNLPLNGTPGGRVLQLWL